LNKWRIQPTLPASGGLPLDGVVRNTGAFLSRLAALDRGILCSLNDLNKWWIQRTLLLR